MIVQINRTRLLGTKAETLERLRPHQGFFRIPEFLYFDAAQWQDDAQPLLQTIAATFGGRPLAVRSSARGEDAETSSMAGQFTSVLGVAAGDPVAVRSAVEAVIASFGADCAADQILVQELVADVSISGVAMTHGLDDGSPYYSIEYDDESGTTHAVTAGLRINKSLRLHRDVGEAHLTSRRMRQVLRLIRNIEGVFGRLPLDIEFALGRDGTVHVFQVRQIASHHSWDAGLARRVDEALRGIADFLEDRLGPRPGVLGRQGVLGTMTDWNPAEMIGSAPRRLAFSLYRHLITDDVWATARAAMGYRPMPGEALMVGLAGRPYIDVRNSFNSFLPTRLAEPVAERLVDAALDRLAANPALHDKVEFEVMPTGLDFRSAAFLEAAYGDVLGDADRAAVLDAYRDHMNHVVGDGRAATLATAGRTVAELAARQQGRPLPPATASGSPLPLLAAARRLVEEARRLGTPAFAVQARHAFLAEALLRSLVERGALAPERLAAFKLSIRTVAGDLTEAMHRVATGVLSKAAFFAGYGHLRPGTYDVLSPRYDQRADLFAGTRLPGTGAAPDFAPTPAERGDIERLIAEAGLRLDGADALLGYARAAITGREHGKFVFSRNVSDALELIAAWGGRRALDRDDISHLEILPLLDQVVGCALERDGGSLRDRVAEGRSSHQCGAALHLSFILRSIDELYVAPQQRAEPNFVTKRRAAGPLVVLDPRSAPSERLDGAVACIESADPGFDWIFTHGIAGLVTKYGGANSHMAIRCAEFGIPAVIGCGEVLFDQILRARGIEIDAANRHFVLH